MFRHCVLMRFEPSATDDKKAAAVAGIEGLRDTVPGIRSMSVGRDAGLRDDNWDVAVIVDFDDRAAYEVYATHPAHVDMLTELVRPILGGRAAVQHEA